MIVNYLFFEGEFDWQFLSVGYFNLFAGGVAEKFHIVAKY